MEIFFVIYMVLGYIAVKNTIDANKTFVYTGNALFLRRVTLGFLLGWILIPWWILKSVFGNK